jgi:hypothetical protein
MPSINESSEAKRLREIRKAIARIRTLDSQSLSVDELVPLLDPLIKGWHVTVSTLSVGQKLFRGRVLDAPPANLSDMSYPPPGDVEITQGRANREGTSLFYCSIHRNPVVFELRPQVGSRIAVIHYRTTEVMVPNIIGYTEKTFRSLKAKREIPDHGKLNLDSYSKADALVRDFLSELFTQVVPLGEEWRYSLSVAVAERMTMGDTIDALIYPTIPMWANSDNLAIKPSFADRGLEALYAEFLEVTAVGDTSFEVNILDEGRGFGVDGEIRWLGHQGTWQLQHQGDTLVFEAEDGHWIARNGSGDVVHPT